MQDNITFIFSAMMLVVLFILFPLYNLFERQDDMSYVTALRSTTNFIDQIRTKGYIDEEMLHELINDLSTTGNLYTINMEAHRQVFLKDATHTYSVGYIIDYTDDIFKYTSSGVENINHNGLTLKNDVYYLNKGDKVYIEVKNSNVTLATILLNFLKLTDNTEKINIRYGGTVSEASWKQ
jgi:hypothetical protein